MNVRGGNATSTCRKPRLAQCSGVRTVVEEEKNARSYRGRTQLVISRGLAFDIRGITHMPSPGCGA